MRDIHMMHNFMEFQQCATGFSSSFSLNMGTKSPHSSTIGTVLGKLGITEKLKGANLHAKITSIAFDILNQ